jgi:hypothetical protein
MRVRNRHTPQHQGTSLDQSMHIKTLTNPQGKITHSHDSTHLKSSGQVILVFRPDPRTKIGA